MSYRECPLCGQRAPGHKEGCPMGPTSEEREQFKSTLIEMAKEFQKTTTPPQMKRPQIVKKGR